MAEDQAQAAEVVTAAVDDSKPIKEKEETSKGIEELLQDGAHCLALGKFSESVEHYAFAVEKLVNKHAELHIETANALEAYGNALLKNAISQSAVLGGDSSKEKVAPADTSALNTSVNSPSADTATASTSSSSTTLKKPGLPADPITVNNINFHFGGDAEEEEEEENDEDDADEDAVAGDDVDDFETAWEVLDTARAILSKEDSKQRQLQLARVHCSMAEVATESGRPEDGVKEYETALRIQTSLLEDHDRTLAQTHLFIALALELVPTNQFDGAAEEAKVAEASFTGAVQHVEKAKEVLKNRELYLKNIHQGKGKEKAGEEEKVNGSSEVKALSEKDLDEIKDLEELRFELDNKVEDLKAQIVESQTKTTSLKDQIYASAPSLPSNISKEVHNLNSLVKKKPKSTAPAHVEQADASVTSQLPLVAPLLQETASPHSITNGKRKADEDIVKEDGDVEKRKKIET